MNIGKAIRFLRKEKGWTQQQLADFSCTSKGNISNLENGHQGYSPALLNSLSVAFSCPISKIFVIAESFEAADLQNTDKLENLPVDVLFLSLSPDLQKSFLALLIDVIQSSKEKH